MTEYEVEVIDSSCKWTEHLSITYRKQFARLNKNFPFERSIFIDIGILPHDAFMELLGDPDDAIQNIKGAILNERLIPNWDPNRFDLNVRFFNHPQKIPVRELKSGKIGKFVSFEGVVTTVMPSHPVVKLASFRCPCGRRFDVRQNSRELLYPPELCTCGRARSQLKLDPSRSETKDLQVILVSESRDNVLGSEVPATVQVELLDDLVGTVTAGNRVLICGTLDAFQKKREDKILEVIFSASTIEVVDKEFADIEISAEEEVQILELARSPDLWSSICGSVAPSIHGSDDVKEAIALQLFGGVSERGEDGVWNRGDIHVLLVGDPGIAKSAMLSAVLALCPRGLMTSGKGASTAGLTASAVQGGDGGWTIHAGAAVLADKGQLLVDELDKMAPPDRSSLHQAMEQQTVPINKAGINTVLMSRCSILAAANPKTGRFDSYSDIASQFDLPSTLLSRFDMVFVCRDVVDEQSDSDLAEFILRKKKTHTSPLPQDFLRKYIAYAKKEFKPTLTDESVRYIADFYVRLRQMGGEGKPMPITPRQLEGLRRMAQASARSRLSQTVDLVDAMRAVRIVEKCLKHVAYDPETSTFDIDKVTSSRSFKKREGLTDLKAAVIAAGNGGNAHILTIMKQMETYGHSLEDAERWLEEGCRMGCFVQPRRDYYRVI